MKCPNCDREDFISVQRVRTLVEFRNVNTKRSGVGSSAPYKGNWKKEKETLDKKLNLRCNACEYVITAKDIDGIGEIKIDKNKGVSFVSDFFDTIFGE
jgi:ribosomal protein L44E